MTPISKRIFLLLPLAFTLAIAVKPGFASGDPGAAPSAGATAPALLAPATAKREWSWQLPQAEKVDFRGVVSFDRAGTQSGSFLYPAPNAAGLLVAILTHGAIVESVKAREKSVLQQEADKVLAPYLDVLEKYTYGELAQAAMAKTSVVGASKLAGPEDKPGSGWMLETLPVMSMAQDSTAIVLDNLIKISGPGAVQGAGFQVTVRVISDTKEVPDPVSYWNSDQGAKLKEESAALLAKSIDIALQAMDANGKTEEAPHRTIRYAEGRTEKMARAQIVRAQCQRLLIRDLRGTYLSVPVAALPSGVSAESQCGATAMAGSPGK